jgi:hypothetical protein
VITGRRRPGNRQERAVGRNGGFGKFGQGKGAPLFNFHFDNATN